MLRRGPSADSYNSNPDADVGSSEDGLRGPGGPGPDSSNLLRIPTPIPGSPASRPPRDSLARQSLVPPNGGASGYPGGFESNGPGIPRRSFIPYHEFPDRGMPMSRAPTRPQTQYPGPGPGPGQYYPNQSQAPSSFVNLDVEENMLIDPNYAGRIVDDEEFVLRHDPRIRQSRLRRFADALLKPFRGLKSLFRIPKALRRRNSIVTEPVSAAASSGFHIRDRTPATSSIRQIYSREGDERDREPTTVMFPEAMTMPQTMTEAGTEAGRDPRSPGHSDSAHGHSASHHSFASPRSPSHRSYRSHRDTIKPAGRTVRSSGTTRTRTTRTTRSSFSAFSPLGGSKDRSSRSLSYISNCSALLHQFTLLFGALRALYHLPWMADPPKRIAADFIPALSKRSKYRARRGPPMYPPAVISAANAAAKMESSEGKSWYRPSPQQLEKQLKRGKGSSKHGHGHGHSHSHSHRSLEEAYAALFPDEARYRHGHSRGHGHGHGRGQPFYVYGPNLPPNTPPFPQPQTSGPYPPPTPGAYYILPGPPPQTAGGAGGNGNGAGIRAPPPARPSSVVSFSLRPAPRPERNGGSTQPPPQNPDPGSTAPRSEVQRPPPAAQPMYMFVQAPTGPPPHHLPPGYASNLPVYPYPYSPPWTPTPQRI